MSVKITELNRSNNAVRNPNGIWINSNVFTEEARHFKRYGYYCPDPKFSPAWLDYWTEQQRRCVEGYEVGGVKITGHHYNYLNFSQIKLTEDLGGNVGKKTLTFPDFWDGDYNYFHILEIARYGIKKEDLVKLGLSVKPEHLDGARHLIVGKSRRKGYSYKNGAICANIYNTIEDSVTIIGAFNKEFLYPKGTMGMASDYLNFYNEHTAWAKGREYKDVQEHRRASYVSQNEEGIQIEAGYKSSIQAITFKDNPDAARGKDATLLLFEEAGKFPNLEDSFMATEPTLRDGKFITGQIVIFGTGGDMENGTIDFANMFYNPDSYNLLSFENIWDENTEGSSCGFFHPFYWNNTGYYDKQGNSDVETALKDEEDERTKLRLKSGGSKILQKRVQEYPKNPAEAFLTVSVNDFPVVELRNRKEKILREKLHEKLGQPGILYRDATGKTCFKPDLHNVLLPVWNRIPDEINKEGCVVIYEYPVPNSPRGLYKIGYDPISQDEGTSMAAIYVKKGHHQFSFTRDTIVASYIGRMKDVDAMHRTFEMLCELYNSEGMHENMVADVKSYFRRIKKLHLLASQPDQVISKAIKNSGVNRVYGCHMDERLKDLGAKYTKQWLLTERDMDSEGNILTNIDFINDPGFCEELILWNKKGNFDRVSAWFMVMIQDQEEELNKVFGSREPNEKLKDLASLKDLLYKKN